MLVAFTFAFGRTICTRGAKAHLSLMIVVSAAAARLTPVSTTTALASRPCPSTTMAWSGSSLPHTFWSIVTRTGANPFAVVVIVPVTLPVWALST